MKPNTLMFATLLCTGFILSFSAPAQAAGQESHTVVRDGNGHVVRSSSGLCVRTRWISENAECGSVRIVQNVEHHQIADEARTVYFEFNKTGLMDSEQVKLSSLTNELKSMHGISGVSIIGYADRMGSTGYNERLSEQRASVVEEYLRAHGYLNTTVAKTRWLGESEPITQCADSLEHKALIACLQNDRRVTVEIKYEEGQSDGVN